MTRQESGRLGGLKRAMLYSREELAATARRTFRAQAERAVNPDGLALTAAELERRVALWLRERGIRAAQARWAHVPGKRAAKQPKAA